LYGTSISNDFRGTEKFYVGSRQVSK